jgi:hypothetical protein
VQQKKSIEAPYKELARTRKCHVRRRLSHPNRETCWCSKESGRSTRDAKARWAANAQKNQGIEGKCSFGPCVLDIKTRLTPGQEIQKQENDRYQLFHSTFTDVKLESGSTPWLRKRRPSAKFSRSSYSLGGRKRKAEVQNVIKESPRNKMAKR